MANPVDELFGQGPPRPPERSPVAGLAWQFVVATLLVLAGPLCCTSVPGTLLALWVWTRADEVVTMADTGVVGEADGYRALRLRRSAFGLMTFASFTILVQLALAWTGDYDTLAHALVDPALRLIP